MEASNPYSIKSLQTAQPAETVSDAGEKGIRLPINNFIILYLVLIFSSLVYTGIDAYYRQKNAGNFYIALSDREAQTYKLIQDYKTSINRYSTALIDYNNHLKNISYSIDYNDSYSIKKKETTNINKILKFDLYYKIFFNDNSTKVTSVKSLQYNSSENNNNIFDYFKEIANIVSIKTEDGEALLNRAYQKILFVEKWTALYSYLNPSIKPKDKEFNSILIFPFGINQSQYQAVKNAMENQISVIEGPPGTGKTQTILNIIANILMQGKTVQIVSNNNSATENVYEKLSSPKYNLGFIAATLGSSKNKKLFVEHQDAAYPDFS